jgi:H+/Cl- antiporter ClcA
MNEFVQIKIRWCAFAAIAGGLAGIAASVFLHLLDWATKFRDSHPQIIWALPLAGLFIGWVYHRLGRDVAPGTNLIMDEMHDPKKTLPVKMAPFVLIGTVLTHLFGGSAGREGTAVQMGASLADQLSRYFAIPSEERRTLLVCGAGAGFGAAIGAPWAGVIFGAEVIHVGRLRSFALVEAFIASFTAYGVSHLLHSPHTIYPSVTVAGFSWMTMLWAAVFGLACGLTARLFTLFTHEIEKVEARWISYPPLKPLLAGVLLIALYWWEGTYRFTGLGIPIIQEAFAKTFSWDVPLLKAGFTALTIGSGFKGGEFIPLVFIGATLGSFAATILPVAGPILAACGFAAVFAGAAAAPAASAVMGVELFGRDLLPYIVVACFASAVVAGESRIYRRRKSSS